MKLSELQPNVGQIPGVPRNPRYITEDEFEKLKKSLRGFRKMLEARPMVVEENNVILGGNMRYQGLLRLASERAIIDDYQFTDDIPDEWVKRVIGWTAEEKREFVMKDNQERGKNDWDILANEWDLDELKEWDIDLKITFDDDNDEKEAEIVKTKDKLRKNWVIPPFSCFDCRQGYWTERKKMWRSIVTNSQIGQSREGTTYRPEMRYPKLYQKSQEIRKKLGISFREYLEKHATKEDLQLDSYSASGTSLFDPVLAEVIMRWFCPENGKILDPFGGEQTKGIVAGVLGKQYTAVEIRKEQVDINTEACKEYGNVKYLCGDSNNISEIVKESEFDLVFTSPPYYDLEVYSKEDMSSLGTYDEFMNQYENIFRQCVEKMADNSFLVVKVGEIRNKKTTNYRNFVGDNISCMMKLGLNYYDEIILLSPVGTACLRADKSMDVRKVTHVHQNVLVFHKGNAKDIPNKFGKIDLSGFEKMIKDIETDYE